MTIELFKLFYLPVLMHAVEVTTPTKTSINLLNNCINKRLHKIFCMHSLQNIAEMHTIFKSDLARMIFSNRYAKFLDNLYSESVFDS